MVLLNDFKRQWQDTRETALAVLEEVGASGWYILGREVEALEQALAEYWGMRHAVGVASGLDAIEMALKALGCRTGDRVLTTPLSAFPSTLAIIKLGAIPVFVDTDEFGLIDLEACRTLLATRPDVRFFLPVHLYGLPLNMQLLQELAQEFDCRMVEDCAQSIGACYQGIATGAAGRIAAVSFYPTKNLGALGDAGAILTGDPELAGTVRQLRDYGQSSRYRHDVVGYNSRLDDLHAAYLRQVGLRFLSSWMEKRRRAAAAYIAGIRNPLIRVVGAPQGATCNWHLFPVLVAPARKGDFMAWLLSQQVASGEHYPIPIPEQRAMESVPFEVIGEMERARRICRSEVSLPIHPYLTDDEIAQVIDACNAWRG